MTALKIVIVVLVVLVILAVLVSFWVSRPLFDETRAVKPQHIADTDLALTFARSKDGLIWVLSHDGDSLSGVNLTLIYGPEATADLVDFVNGLDEQALVGLAEQQEQFPLQELMQVADFTYPAVAAGTNFTEHAEEVYSDDPPFLFPKLAAPSGWRDIVPFTKRLDFEAELCMFPLQDVTSADALPRFGLVLCNDFTDRLTLIKELSLKRPLGETGFASGKGCPGCLPTGYLAVIPRSDEFYLTLELSLYVNDHLRQRFSMKDVILPIEGIIAQAFEKRQVSYQKGDEAVALLPHGHIPKGTLLLTGTAAGVIFKPLNIWNQWVYLKRGDVVRTEGTFLGHMENTIQ